MESETTTLGSQAGCYQVPPRPALDCLAQFAVVHARKLIKRNRFQGDTLGFALRQVRRRRICRAIRQGSRTKRREPRTIGEFFKQLPPNMSHDETIAALLAHVYELSPDHRPSPDAA
jgi:hypothetical protein